MDLVLPSALPVAELVPELARSVGLLDARTIPGGYRVVTHGGRELLGHASLVSQGVEDGALLTVTAKSEEATPRLYDDVVEAMTDAVERVFEPWDPGTGRVVGSATGGSLVALGVVALLMRAPGLTAGVMLASALGLLAWSAVLSRVQRAAQAPVLVAWLGSVHAAGAGVLLASGGTLAGMIACGGVGAVSSGCFSLLALRERRTLMLPPVVVGAVLLGIAVLVRTAQVGPAVASTTALSWVVLVGNGLPSLALAMTDTRVEPLHSVEDVTADPGEIDLQEVESDVRIAHDLVAAGAASVGILLLLVSPLAVSLGPSGAAVAVMCSMLMTLRARRFRAATLRLVHLVSGCLGLVAIAGSVLCLHPSWRAVTGLVLGVAGSVLVTAARAPSSPSARWRRYGDLLESGALLAVPPLLVVASGALSWVRG